MYTNIITTSENMSTSKLNGNDYFGSSSILSQMSHRHSGYETGIYARPSTMNSNDNQSENTVRKHFDFPFSRTFCVLNGT